MADGILIQHATARSCMHLVVLLSRPYATGPIDCPTCHTWHPCKTVHLWLNDTGHCLVSEGVLEELRMAGMPDLTVVGHSDTPPTLRLYIDRTKQDFEHRKQQVFTSQLEVL